MDYGLFRLYYFSCAQRFDLSSEGAFACLITSMIRERSDPASLPLLSKRNVVFCYNVTFASIPIISVDPRLYFQQTDSDDKI